MKIKWNNKLARDKACTHSAGRKVSVTCHNVLNQFCTNIAPLKQNFKLLSYSVAVENPLYEN